MSYRLSNALRTDDDARALDHLSTYYERGHVGLDEHVSALRVYDVITWMEGRSNGLEVTGAEEQIGEAAAHGAG